MFCINLYTVLVLVSKKTNLFSNKKTWALVCSVLYWNDSDCKYESGKLSLVEKKSSTATSHKKKWWVLLTYWNQIAPRGLMAFRPTEFLEACKECLAEPIKLVLNYITEHRNFPDSWAVGVRSAVFKSGKHNLVDNFRGITILPIMEKIFEAAVYRRLTFVNEAFDEIDKLWQRIPKR